MTKTEAQVLEFVKKAGTIHEDHGGKRMQAAIMRLCSKKVLEYIPGMRGSGILRMRAGEAHESAPEKVVHTPGPWRTHGEKKYYWCQIRATENNETIILGQLGGYGTDREVTHVNAERIVACVNACEGIADPSALAFISDFLERVASSAEVGGGIKKEAKSFLNAMRPKKRGAARRYCSKCSIRITRGNRCEMAACDGRAAS